MGNKTAIPKSPLASFVTSPRVRQHLAKAGEELVLALQEGLKGMALQVRDAQLDGQYPYLSAAIGNVVATVERITQRVRPVGKKVAQQTTKRGKPHDRRTSRS